MQHKNTNEKRHLHALNKIFGVGPQKMKILLNFFPTAEDTWKADLSELIASGIGEKLSERIIEERKIIDPQEEWTKLEKEDINLITITDENYPLLLKEIPHPPYIIYTKGNLNINKTPLISIVGSRKYTQYGQQVAISFSRDLAKAGITVVSGMALGIDTFAHRGTLEAGGNTIAVLGNSLDDESLYPRNNFGLSREIIGNGMLLSEYPPVTLAGKITFPARNRIIAGLTKGTLVVEAGDGSGALLTARMALEYNREVFSIPGSIFSPQSTGTNYLIKSGAKAVTSVSDILEELNLDQIDIAEEYTPKIPSNEIEKKLLSALSGEPLHIDNILRITKLNMATVSSTLSMMEIKGWTKNIGGQNYIII